MPTPSEATPATADPFAVLRKLYPPPDLTANVFPALTENRTLPSHRAITNPDIVQLILDNAGEASEEEIYAGVMSGTLKSRTGTMTKQDHEIGRQPRLTALFNACLVCRVWRHEGQRQLLDNVHLRLYSESLQALAFRATLQDDASSCAELVRKVTAHVDAPGQFGMILAGSMGDENKVKLEVALKEWVESMLVPMLPMLPRLRVLHVINERYEADWQALASLPALRSLRINNASTSVLATILPNLPALQDLEVSCLFLSDTLVENPSPLPFASVLRSVSLAIERNDGLAGSAQEATLIRVGRWIFDSCRHALNLLSLTASGEQITGMLAGQRLPRLDALLLTHCWDCDLIYQRLPKVPMLVITQRIEQGDRRQSKESGQRDEVFWTPAACDNLAGAASLFRKVSIKLEYLGYMDPKPLHYGLARLLRYTRPAYEGFMEEGRLALSIASYAQDGTPSGRGQFCIAEAKFATDSPRCP